jgi:membrane associated rhomboid family serine protease
MQQEDELKKIKYSFILPSLFVFLLWIIKVVDYSEQLNLFIYGVYPRNSQGLSGIFFSPFIHSDFNHLISNSIPLLILGSGIIYFYRELAYKVTGFVWVVSGVCVWIGARESYHIGASGLIYGLAAFLFLSGIIRKDIRLAAISLLVVFLYGGLVWGIFPFFPQISWEYHLFGGLSGFIAAIIYRSEGPRPKEWSWEQEEDSNGEDSNEEEHTEDLDNKSIE